jgi:predicted transcriptional regulator
MKLKTGAAAVILPLLLLAVLSILTASPAEARTPSLQVSISDQDVKIDATLGSPGAAYFSGEVAVGDNEYQSAEVTLTVDAGDWGQSVTPSDKVVAGNGSFTFSAVVTPKADAAEGSYMVRVFAMADTPGSSPAAAQDSVTVLLVRNRVRIECAQPIKVAKAGEAVNFELKIWNDGSTRDTFESTASERRGPIASIMLDQTSLDIEAGQFVYVNVQVQTAAGALPGSYESFFSAQSDAANTSSGMTLTVVIPQPFVRTPDTPAGPNYYLWVGVPLMIAGACLMVYIGGTEIGLLAFLQFIIVPLFVRIKKDRVLDHFTRGQIFGFIKANPGTHYIAIQEHMDLQNGVLAYHLKVLEREEYIVSEREGIYKRFYPKHMKIPRKERQLSRVQVDIISALRTHPGTSQNGLARMLGESKQVIGYHIRVLEKAQIVRVEREAQATRCFLAGEDVRAHGEAEQPPQREEEPPAHEIPDIIKEIRA